MHCLEEIVVSNGPEVLFGFIAFLKGHSEEEKLNKGIKMEACKRLSELFRRELYHTSQHLEQVEMNKCQKFKPTESVLQNVL